MPLKWSSNQFASTGFDHTTIIIIIIITIMTKYFNRITRTDLNQQKLEALESQLR